MFVNKKMSFLNNSKELSLKDVSLHVDYKLSIEYDYWVMLISEKALINLMREEGKNLINPNKLT